jgi:hypothetical protein
MKEFFKDIFSNQSEASSKRFAAIVSLFSIIVITFLATFKADKWVTPEFMFDSLVIITGGGLGLTVIEKIFSKNSSSPKQASKDQSEQTTQPDPVDSETQKDI